LHEKGGKRHELPAHHLAEAAVDAYLDAAGVPASTCCHTFRATGITAYLQNGGTLEKAQQIACHESRRARRSCMIGARTP
jgi:integrase/recombinase XerD